MNVGTVRYKVPTGCRVCRSELRGAAQSRERVYPSHPGDRVRDDSRTLGLNPLLLGKGLAATRHRGLASSAFAVPSVSEGRLRAAFLRRSVCALGRVCTKLRERVHACVRACVRAYVSTNVPQCQSSCSNRTCGTCDDATMLPTLADRIGKYTLRL